MIRSNRSLSRRALLGRSIAIAGISTGIAGCLTGTDGPIDGAIVEYDADVYEITAHRGWAAGTTLEYGGAFVVRGSFRNVSGESRSIPTVVGRFFDGDGETIAEIDGTVRRPAGEAGPETDLGEEIGPDEELVFVFVLDPSDDLAGYEIRFE